jgi:hypothetical protein
MDDLLDLNWSAPASSTVKQPVPKAPLPKDAFADLLNTPPKPVDSSKLSMVEQQRMQQQRQQSSTPSSPWLTPIQATTPSSSTPKYNSSATPPSTASFLETKHSTSNTTSSSFEDLLNPFGSNNSKKLNQDRNTPLNQL